MRVKIIHSRIDLWFWMGRKRYSAQFDTTGGCCATDVRIGEHLDSGQVDDLRSYRVPSRLRYANFKQLASWAAGKWMADREWWLAKEPRLSVPLKKQRQMEKRK